MARVLVVDDQQETAESFRLLLTAWGHEAADANDGQAALTLAATFRPHVALVDIWMPGMDGYEVARGLRALPGMKTSLLVAVTGLAPEGGRLAPDGDFDLCLLKPVEPDDLKRLLDSFSAHSPH
jgi:two-component system CheB/CheR fusion protein